MALKDDNMDLKSSVILDLDQYEKSLNKLEKDTKNSTDKAAESTEKNSDRMKSSFLKIGIAVGAAIGIFQALKKVVEVTTKAFQGQEFAETRLESIAKKVTNATDDQIKSLKELASAQQLVTTYGDEVLIVGQSQLLSFGIQTKSVEKLTRSLTDLLAANKGINATQEDAIQAANTFGKALNGQVGDLSRIGILLNDEQAQLLKTGDEMTRVNALIDIMNQNYGGLAESLAQTREGQVKQFQNAWGDLLETLGAKTSPIISNIATGLKGITVAFDSFLKGEKTSDKLRKLIVEMKNLEDITNPTREQTEKLKKVMNEISLLSPGIATSYDNQGNAILNLKKAVEGLNKVRSIELLNERRLSEKNQMQYEKELKSEEKKLERIKKQLEPLKEIEQLEQKMEIARRSGLKTNLLNEEDQAQLNELYRWRTNNLDKLNEKLRDQLEEVSAIKQTITEEKADQQKINDILEERITPENIDKTITTTTTNITTDTTTGESLEEKERFRKDFMEKVKKQKQFQKEEEIRIEKEGEQSKEQLKKDIQSKILDDNREYSAKLSQMINENEKERENEAKSAEENAKRIEHSEKIKQNAIDKTKDAMKQVTASIISSFYDQEKSTEEALKTTLWAISEQAAVEALFNTGKGIAALARYDLPGAANWFQSAAIMAGVAAISGATSSAIQPSSSGIENQESETQRENNTLQNEADRTESKREVYVNIDGRRSWIRDTLLPEIQQELDNNNTVIIRTGGE